MKITIRPLQRGKAVFEVDAEPSETINQLKLKITAVKDYPVEAQNILSSGKTLQDDMTIESYNIKDASTLILVLKGAPADSGHSASSGTGNRPTGSAGPSESPPGTSAELDSFPRFPPGLSSAIGGPAASSEFGTSSNAGVSQGNIDGIMNLGLDVTREQVVRALHASSDMPDQAVEFLLSGIPEEGAPLGSNSMAHLPGSSRGIAAPDAGSPRNMLQNLQPMGGWGTQGGGLLGGSGVGAEGPEIDPRQVQEIRRMIAENSTLTGPLIESLKETDPEGAARLSTGDPDGILRYFSTMGGHE